VGRRLSVQLEANALTSAFDVARLGPVAARRRWSVVVKRTVRELQGQSCLDLEDAPAPKHEIACTRSFRQCVTTLAELSQAVSEFASKAERICARMTGAPAKC